jgi:hypothetical protein
MRDFIEIYGFGRNTIKAGRFSKSQWRRPAAFHPASQRRRQSHDS